MAVIAFGGPTFILANAPLEWVAGLVPGVIT